MNSRLAGLKFNFRLYRSKLCPHPTPSVVQSMWIISPPPRNSGYVTVLLRRMMHRSTKQSIRRIRHLDKRSALSIYIYKQGHNRTLILLLNKKKCLTYFIRKNIITLQNKFKCYFAFQDTSDNMTYYYSSDFWFC
jgi:hypothetical protein